MSNEYNVVFEHTQKTEGFAGIRFYTAYQDEAEFLKHNDPLDDIFKVVARGITEKEAQNLTSLTPEICRLTAAVEEIYSNGGEINAETLQFHLSRFSFAIERDRQHRSKNGLSPVTPFTFINIDTLKASPKKRLMSYIKEMFYSYDGTIVTYIDYVIACITVSILRIQFEKLHRDKNILLSTQA
jgi:hypothetical protein